MNLLVVLLIAGSLLAMFLPRRPPRWLRDPLFAGSKLQPRRILVTGATGFIGRQVCRRLIAAGDDVLVLARRRERALDLFGPHVTICTSLVEIAADVRIDAIVNLAGEPIISRPWTGRRRRQLIASRVAVTEAVVELIGRLQHKPAVLVTASAVGYYGVRGDEELCEADRGRTIFQSQLCQIWELTAQRAKSHGVRVCSLRLGVVLGRDGGALPQQILAARARIAAVLGSGRQWLSWIHIDDVLRLIEHCLDRGDVDGPINATAPVPVRQHEFARQLAAQFGRSLTVRAPETMLRCLLGERAQLLLDGQRVLPVKALASGFEFQYPRIDEALADLCMRTDAPSDVLYDTFCPICDGEMNTYCRAARRLGKRWQFDDVATRPELMSRYGIDLQTARRRVYVLADSGRMLSGIEALCTIWAALPYWRGLAWFIRLPPVEPLAAWCYDVILAPLIWRWNRRRRAALAAATQTR
ncbi:MAG TPA: TIGR01777 family oxidoreductase [Povalibacter sp.]|uniref:TIGR01777 family oxidoreductase n=1 Tax=Povalibacter sp. TaxID=1962978 RepID=UPI002CDE2622|nr:TIGR01777 family oxidoreductase [Povalibacter sp.]HMN44268.1 TIGR01777 family oxidoreductase [Povalibacter sp.]